MIQYVLIDVTYNNDSRSDTLKILYALQVQKGFISYRNDKEYLCYGKKF